MKVKVDASEMFGAEVQFLSLVGAGANRAPFKIQKADRGARPMINFKKMFEIAKDEAPAEPALVAIAVSPLGDTEAAEKLIEAAGLTIEHKREIDGATIYLQSKDAVLDTGNQVAYMAGNGIAAICHVDKGFEPFSGSTNFIENLMAQGFFPNVSLAQAILKDTIFTVMFEAESAEQAKAEVDKATEDFRGHISTMVAGLPQDAFKLEEVIQKAFAMSNDPQPGAQMLKPTDQEKPLEESTSPTMNKEEGGEDRKGKGKGKDKGKPAFLKGKDDIGGQNDLTAGEQAAADQNAANKAKPEALALALKVDLPALIAAAVKPLAEQVAKIAQQVGELAPQVATAVQVAKAADAAVTGRIAGEAPGDESPAGENSGPSDPPLMDSGMLQFQQTEVHADQRG